MLKNVYRYNLVTKQGDQLANMRLERAFACGASAHGKIFVAGGINRCQLISNTCEVYDETTNEWQLIASLYMPTDAVPQILSVDDALYALGRFHDSDSLGTKIECYDPDKDEWNETTEIPERVDACSMRIFKGLLSDSIVSRRDQVETPSVRRCLIM